MNCDELAQRSNNDPYWVLYVTIAAFDMGWQGHIEYGLEFLNKKLRYTL